MPAAVAPEFRVENAKAFRERLFAQPHYAFLGKTLAWDNDTDTPPGALKSIANFQVDAWRSAVAGKRIKEENFSFVIPRHDWTAGEAYDMYDDKDPSLVSKKWIVVTDEFKVYACIDRPEGAVSTVKPTTVSSEITQFSTSDRYRWKYLYSISGTDSFNYLTENFIPVKNVDVNPSNGSEAELQFDVQSEAVDGSIVSIKVINEGVGYVSSPTVTITGDGTGATAQAIIVGGKISYFVITNPGEGYSYADVTVAGGSGFNGSGRVIISPRGGFGSDMLQTTMAYSTLISVPIEGNEGEAIGVGNDVRQNFIVTSPLNFGTNIPASSDIVRQTVGLTLINISGNIETDQYIVQPSTGASGYVVRRDGNTVYLTDVKKSFTNGSISSTDPFLTAFIFDVINPDVQPFTGSLIYLDNRVPVTRSDDQTETIRVILEW